MATHEGSITLISDLDPLFPKGATDFVYNGDDEVRQLKTTLQGTFTNVTGAVTSTHTELNYMDGFTGAAIPASWTYFGTAAPEDVGTAVGNVLQFAVAATLPALSAVNLTNVPIDEHFNNLTSLVTTTSAELNALIGVTAFGTAHALDVGTAIGDIPQLENVLGAAALPAVDGSQLTNINTTDILLEDIEISKTKDGQALMYWFGTQ